MVNFLNKIKYFFSKEFRLYHFPIYIDLGFHKLWKDWWKVRKDFTRPELVYHKGDMGNFKMYDYYMDIHASTKVFENKLFAFHIEPLGWKSKYGFYEFVYEPEIVFVFNKKVIFTIRMEEPLGIGKYEYWQNLVNELFIKPRK